MKSNRIFTIVVIALGLIISQAQIVHGVQYLTVNDQDVNSITLELGQIRTIEVVSTDATSYVDYVGFDIGVILGTFSYLKTMDEAGNLANVLDYNVPAFKGYYVSATGTSPAPSAGIHFVFEYMARELGKTYLTLYDSTFTSVIDSVKITVIPLQPVEMGTAFTYQGRLLDINIPADGLYDFQFKLYDNADPVFAVQQGSTIDINDLDVIDGYFTVELDFGSDVFDGEAVWLEIGVRPGDGTGSFTKLSPRQEVTPTPNAIYAQMAQEANTIDGLESGDFAMRIHAHRGEDITAGTISTDYYSAYGDLFAEGYLGNNTGDIAQNNGIVQQSLNADMLDGLSEGEFFRLAQSEEVTGRPAFNGGVSGLTAPFYVDSTNVVVNLNADGLDGLHSTSFATSGHIHDYDATYVNVTGDSMTGALEVYDGTTKDYAVKGEGQLGPTNGYLGVQGKNSYDGITSTHWLGWEIGVAGISTGSSTTDNYGVLGHASRAGVRGELSGDPNHYGELGRSGGYGVYANGTNYAGYFIGGKNYFSGNVGIGTTSPVSRLHVADGCITGSMCSDIRLKKNIEPLPLDDSILDRVLGLQAVTFEWKHRDDGKRQISLIAQDVEEVFPEVVTTTDDESCEKGLLATGLDAVLVEAIKELKAENELLKERLEDLERIIQQYQFNVAKKVQ